MRRKNVEIGNKQKGRKEGTALQLNIFMFKSP